MRELQETKHMTHFLIMLQDEKTLNSEKKKKHFRLISQTSQHKQTMYVWTWFKTYVENHGNWMFSFLGFSVRDENTFRVFQYLRKLHVIGMTPLHIEINFTCSLIHYPVCLQLISKEST